MESHENERRSGGWHILAAAVALAGTGCAAEVPSAAEDGPARAAVAAIDVVDEATFAELDDDVEVWLDLRDATRGYLVDAAAVPLDRVALICPNGQVMPWGDWVAADPELAARARGPVGLALGPDIAERALGADNPCPADCYLCADGVTLCHPDFECLGEHSIQAGSVSVDARDPLHELWHHGGRWLPPDPTPPSGEGSSGGGSGGVPDPTPPPSGGGSGSGDGGGSGSSGGSRGGGSPGAHPGWG